MNTKTSKPSFDLADEMLLQLKIKENPVDKLSAALDHLSLAATGLEKIQNNEGVEIVTSVIEDISNKIAGKKSKPNPLSARDKRIKELDKLMENEYAREGKSTLFEALIQEQERLIRDSLKEKFPTKKEVK